MTSRLVPPVPSTPEPRYFATSGAFRAWLEANHDTAAELWVGYHKKATGRSSMTWSESVDEALCFGWIDGIRKSIDAERYTIRFTPRRAKSTWSAVNIAKVAELQQQGRMHPAGEAAFALRVPERSRRYSYEGALPAELTPSEVRRFRRTASAWKWFQGRPSGYRRQALHWITSAKREETRARRLQVLIDHSAAEAKIPPLAPPAKRSR